MKTQTLDHIESFKKRYPELADLMDKICEAVNILIETHKNGGTILVCGNGGSAADSEHMAGELLKSFMLKRPIDNDLKVSLVKTLGETDGNHVATNLQQGVRCVPLTSFPAFASAFANDCAPEINFAQLVGALGRSGDVLVAFSTSGNSKNVIFAAAVASAYGIKVISLTGKTGGKLKDFSDILLNVPSSVVYEIQEYHLPIYHLICLIVESELFES